MPCLPLFILFPYTTLFRSHWSPCSSLNPVCTGCSWPFCSSPSTVRTDRPFACTANNVHDLTGLSSSSTVHAPQDRKSTRLNSSHLVISYAVFCLQKKTANQ